MTILWVKEKFSGRSGSINDSAVREYNRCWLVKTTTYYSGPVLIRLAANSFGIPLLFSYYQNGDGSEHDTGAILQSFDTRKNDEAPNLWELEATYSTLTKDQQSHFDSNGQPILDPLKEPQEVEFTFSQFQKPIEKTIYGEATVNSTGDAYDPPIMIDDSRLVLRISKNEPTFDPHAAVLYQDAVNEDSFLGFGPGMAKINNLRGLWTSRNGVRFSQNTYEIHFRPEGWDIQVLDRGYAYLDSNNRRVRACDAQQRPLADPILLNGAGKPLQPLNSAYPGAVGTLAPGTVLPVGGTEIVLVTPPGITVFPTPPFDIKIGTEVMTVVSAAVGPPDTLTVIRNTGGTPLLVAAAAPSVLRMMPYYKSFAVYRRQKFAPLGLYLR